MLWLTPASRSFKKKLNRINYSRTTLLYVSTLIIQLGFVELFQIKLDARDVEVISLLKFYNGTNPDCVKDHFDQYNFSMLSKELFLFIYFQVFLFWLGFDAISTHHMDQAKAVALLNASGAFYGFARLIETKIPIDKYNANCGQFGRLYGHYLSNDVPNIFVMLMLSGWLGYLTKLLNNELGDRIYQKIGSDRRMREMFKTRLTFIMLLKVNVFFLLFMLIPIFTMYSVFFAILHLVITSIALGMAYAAYRAIPKEKEKVIQYFVAIWTLVVIDWIATLVGSLILASLGSLFMLFFASQYVFYGIMTIVYANKVIQTFDKGMREYVGREIQSHKLESFVPVIKVIDYETPKLEKPVPALLQPSRTPSNNTTE